MKRWIIGFSSKLIDSWDANQNEASDRILDAARAMNDDIHSLAHMRKMPIDQLSFIAKQQAAKHRLYSLMQGNCWFWAATFNRQ
ncbi:hypothetical protein ACI2OX_07825 [Bacillus sp. N9]